MIPPTSQITPSQLAAKSIHHPEFNDTLLIGQIDPYFVSKDRIKSFLRSNYHKLLNKIGCGKYDDWRAFKNGIPAAFKDIIPYYELHEKQNILVIIVTFLHSIIR